MKYGLLKRLALPLLGVLALGSCTQTEIIDGPSPVAKETQVSFSVELPDVTTPSTRGIQTETEAAIDNFYVLVFDKDDEFAYKKIVQKSAFTSETSGASSTAKEIKTFTVGLTASEDNLDLYSIVLLANIPASGALKTAVDAIAVGDDMDTALTDLTQSYSANPTMPVPMASIPKTTKVKVETGMATQTFNMIRMVARIDVTLAASVAANYSVRQVLFYNYNTIGRVWTNNYTGTAVSGIAALANRGTATTGSSYAVSNKLANSGVGPYYETNFEALLYAQEAAVSAVATRPCIVIELENKSGVSQGFYRAEFFAASGTNPYLDILRNHRYLFNVTAVNGTGFSTANDAYNSAPAGLTTDVISIDEAEIKEIVVSGQYWLGVSTTNVELNAGASNEAVIAMTNVPTGWVFDTSVHANGVEYIGTQTGWLTTAKGTETTSGTVKKADIELASTINTTGIREAYIHIKAGSLTQKVKVTQKAVAIKIYDATGTTEITSLTFNSKNSLIGIAPVSQDYIVKWEPAELEPAIVKTTASNANEFTWQDISSNSLTDLPSGGSFTYEIDPVGISQANVDSNPFYSKVSTMTYTIDDGNGQTATASIVLNHVHYQLLAENFGSVYINTAATTGTVKCNTNWTVSLTDNASGICTNYTPKSAAASTSGRTFTYTLTGSSTPKYAIFTFTHPSGLFDPVEVKVWSGLISTMFAKSNIVYNGGYDFAVTAADNARIPADAQGVYFRLHSIVPIDPQAVAPVSSTEILPALTWFNDTPSMYTAIAYDKNIAGYDASYGSGDPCQWVKSGWRLPDAYELSQLMYETAGTLPSTIRNPTASFYVTALVSGKGMTRVNTTISAGLDRDTSHDITVPPPTSVTLPFSGYRDQSNLLYGWNGMMNRTSYPFRTPGSPQSSGFMQMDYYSFNSNTLQISWQHDSAMSITAKGPASPVRCIRNYDNR